MSEQHLGEQEIIRREKLETLREMGIDPFGEAFDRTHRSQDIVSKFSDKTKEELEDIHQEVIIAGRIMTKRIMGKAGFLHLQDRDGQIQVYIRKDTVGDEQFDYYKLCDLGDIIGVNGVVFRTNHGELSVKATKLTHLTKALNVLPDKFHGLTDKEERYRRRYLDLISNEEARNLAFFRPKVIRAIQHYLDAQGLVEVETPILQPILGGASARPFVTHHNALDMNFYLRIATELPLKRLIVGGMEGVYEIGRLFRNEGMDSTHNPEFTTVEAYVAYSDMQGMMKLTEGLIESVAVEVLGKRETEFHGHIINLDGPFRRARMVDLVSEKTGRDFLSLSTEEALAVCKEYGLELDKHQQSYGHAINELFELLCEKDLIQPTFVYGHPVEVSPLAKMSKEDSRFTDRFELFINGAEYCNAFSELNDPIDQKQRFEAQLKEKELGNVEANEMDIDYVEALEYGLPPTGGLGLGIDRLIMLLSGQESIREVLLFPHMKHRTGTKNEEDN
ncbi:MAG: lysine--tRNA ligase [Erysipelothrix sp.]|nr:lysine--tRNA ligase [Erysipelothrix sp.]